MQDFQISRFANLFQIEKIISSSNTPEKTLTIRFKNQASPPHSQTHSILSTSYRKKLKRSITQSSKKKSNNEIKYHQLQIINNPSISTIQGEQMQKELELQENEQKLRKKIIAQEKYRNFKQAESRKQIERQQQKSEGSSTPNMTAYSKFSKLDVDQVTYDSNGKVLQLYENQRYNKKKKKTNTSRKSLYETVSYNMFTTADQNPKSKTKLPLNKRRKEDHLKFKNDKQFFQKIQKQHEINHPAHHLQQNKKDVFMTSLKQQDFKFSHPKFEDKSYKNNASSPWVIKPGIKVLENGKLVISQNRISHENKMSLYSFNQKVQQEYKEYVRQQGGGVRGEDLSEKDVQPQKSLQSRPRLKKGIGSVSSKSSIYLHPTQSNENQSVKQKRHILKFPSLPRMNQRIGAQSLRTIQSNQRPPSGKIPKNDLSTFS